MDALIDNIRAALANDASDEAKATGVAACRSILAAILPAAPGPHQAPGNNAPTLPANTIAAAAATLRGVPIEQLLDLAIAKLRPLVPPETASASPPFRVHLVKVPRP